MGWDLMGLWRVFFTEMGGLCFVEMEKTRDLLGECDGGGGRGGVSCGYGLESMYHAECL